tara:strand:+ start:7565 stop:7768 length:204 start_codon:yes stop_codon:yes gene_type:complete
MCIFKEFLSVRPGLRGCNFGLGLLYALVVPMVETRHELAAAFLLDGNHHFHFLRVKGGRLSLKELTS